MKSSPPVSSQNRWADWLFPSCTAGKWASGKDNHGGFQQVQLSATDPREVLHGIADPRAWNSGKDAVLSSLYLAWEIHIFLQWLSWYVLVNHSVCPRTHLSSTQLTDLNFHLCVCSPETSLDKELKLCCRVVAHILYNQVIIEDQGPWEPVTRTGHAKWGNTATDHWWVAKVQNPHQHFTHPRWLHSISMSI